MGAYRIQRCNETGEASIVLKADVGVVVQRVLLPVVVKVVPRLWVLHRADTSDHKLQQTPAIYSFCI